MNISYPSEILFNIFSFLEIPDLIHCSLGNHQFAQTAQDPVLWKLQFKALSEGWLPEEEPESWKELTKKVFFFEVCLWNHEKAQRQLNLLEKPLYKKVFKKRKVSLEKYQFLLSPENTIYYFFSLCGGPKKYHSIPLGGSALDPSFFPKNRKKKHVIVRQEFSKYQITLRFYTTSGESGDLRQGIGEIRFRAASHLASDLGDLIYFFKSRVIGLFSKETVLIRGGIIRNYAKYISVCEQVKLAIEQQSLLGAF